MTAAVCPCDVCRAGPEAMERDLVGERTPLTEARVRAALRVGLDQALPAARDKLADALVFELATHASAEAVPHLLWADATVHGLSEVYPSLGADLDASADRWYARLRPRLLATIEASLPELEAELVPAFLTFAREHPSLVRPPEEVPA